MQPNGSAMQNYTWSVVLFWDMSLLSGVRKSLSYREWEIGNRKQGTALIDFQVASLEL